MTQRPAIVWDSTTNKHRTVQATDTLDSESARAVVDAVVTTGISADVGNQIVVGNDGKLKVPNIGGVSTDAGNQLVAGSDKKPYFKQTVTSLTYDNTASKLSFKDEAGNTTVIDLAALAADIYVNGAAFDPASLVLTLKDNNAGTPDVTVDLSKLHGKWTNNGNGTYTYDAGNGSTFTLDFHAIKLPYDNTASGLAGTNVQAAIDNLDARVDAIETLTAGVAPATSVDPALPSKLTGTARDTILADPSGWMKINGKNVPYWN